MDMAEITSVVTPKAVSSLPNTMMGLEDLNAILVL